MSTFAKQELTDFFMELKSIVQTEFFPFYSRPLYSYIDRGLDKNIGILQTEIVHKT